MSGRIRRGPMPPGFEVYRDRAGKWRWRLFAANGLVIAISGECFSSRRKCLDGVTAVRTTVADRLDNVRA